MARRKKELYPAVKEAREEARKSGKIRKEEKPDFIGMAPNYDKFKKWEPEKVLAWLNID